MANSQMRTSKNPMTEASPLRPRPRQMIRTVLSVTTHSSAENTRRGRNGTPGMFESANNSTAIPSFGRDEHCGQEDGVITVLEKQGKSKSDQDARDSHRADTIRTGGFPMPIHDW